MKEDKSNITVAMSIADYKGKIDDVLNDLSTYTIMNKNPVKNLDS